METVYHTIRNGESAEKIAKSYGIKLDDLLAWNGMTKKSTLRAGQKIKIMTAAKTTEPPHRERTASAPAAKYFAKNTHIVGRGETATLIAKKYDIALADLLGWNNLTAKSVLKVGDKLVVRQAAANTAASGKRPADVASSTGSGTVRHVHSVAVGEGLNEIADEYDVSVNTLMQWNGWSEAPKLGKGDEVVVYQPAPAQD
jgi:LysM repeat protein